MKFLLVDDSSTMRTIQKRSLERLGYTDVIEAADGKAALDCIASAAPNLIVTDWNMPTMNGLEFVKSVRAVDKKTPIIMVTTEAEKPKVIEAIQAGVNDYLIKPFAADAFAEKVRKLVKS